MGIEHDDVKRIAELAGLEPGPEDMVRLEKELDGILAQMELLANVPLDEGDAQVEVAAARLRADEPNADPLARPVREMAPAWREGFFTVPRLAALGEAGADGGGGGGDGAGGDR